MKPSSISARLVGLLAALLLIISALAAPPALAKAACNSAQPTADIGLVQAVSAASSNGDYVDHLRITNYGPCNVPNATLTATLPSPLVASSSNPNSWICSLPGAIVVTCSETSTIGVPGTADIYLEYKPVKGLVHAEAPFAACPTLGQPPVPLCDPNQANNTSTVAAGLIVGPPDSLTYGPTFNGKPDPSSAVHHTTTVALDSGGFVNIYQTADDHNCPPAVSKCFLGTITINITLGSPPPTPNPKTWTLTFLAALANGKPLSQITVWNSVGGGAYTALTSCSGKNHTDPCVLSRAKSANSAGDTIYTIIVQGSQDNGMTAD